MRVFGILLGLGMIAWGALAQGAEFRAVADMAAVLYDAPSAKAKKLYILNLGYPVEVVVVVEGWTKIRDAAGELAWMESKALAAKRTVMIKVPVAQVRQNADDQAPVVFQAQRDVILDLVDAERPGWLHVRHADGASGYIKPAQVWGV
jgi:SH3-like domain-containing protein